MHFLIKFNKKKKKKKKRAHVGWRCGVRGWRDLARRGI